MTRPGFEGTGLLPHTGEEFAGEQEPAGRKNETDNQNQSHVIGLPDIDEDLLWIDQIIHGHGVEARLEFLKKEKCDEKQKNLDVARNEKGSQQDDPVPAGGKPAFGNDHHPKEKRQCEDDGHEDIAMEAVQEREDYLSGRQSGGSKGEEEHQPQNEPRDEQRAKPERG